MIRRLARLVVRLAAIGVAVAALVYGVLIAAAWLRYGTVAAPAPAERDALLDSFMPAYEIVERHAIAVDAPAAATLAAARQMDVERSWIARAIFRARERILGTEPDTRLRAAGLIEDMQAIGWGILAEVPGREVVVGAYTKPWEANVTFHALPPDRFAAFNEPGYVKIAWTIRADPVTDTRSIFRTETRAVATDPDARRTFRRYWSIFSPGIIVIRWMLLEPVRNDAERAVQG